MSVHKLRLGVFGGSFDPVHKGHVYIANTAAADLSLDKVHLIPCKKPVYRDPAHQKSNIASASDRLAMLKLAIADFPLLEADPRELKRESDSYTVETLASLRADFADSELAFILGSDSFATLHTWRNYQEILKLAHLVVVGRPGSDNYPAEIQQLLAERECQSPDALWQQEAGNIYFLPFTPMAISSTFVRNQVLSGEEPKDLVPAAVIDYIASKSVYNKS